MKVVDRFNVSKPSEGPKKYTFVFTGSGFVSLAVVAALGIAWIFFLGVVLGRGNKPENAMPQLAKIMPTSSTQQENKDQPKVLAPEELQFQDTLQGKKPPETVTVDSTKKSDDAQAPQNSTMQAPADKPADAGRQAAAMTSPPAQAKPPQTLPKGQVATAPALPDKKTVKQEAEKNNKADGPDKQKNAKAPPAKQPVQRRAYQVAAMDKEPLAQAEAEKLKKKGLAATVQKTNSAGKIMYRVIVHMKGTDAEIKQSLEKSGIKKPILRD